MAGRKPEVKREEILRQFVISPDPVLGTRELADEFGMSPQGVNYRLEKLKDEGIVDSKKISRDKVWWITEEGRSVFAELID